MLKSNIGMALIAVAILSFIIFTPPNVQQIEQHKTQQTKIETNTNNKLVSDIYGKKINIYEPEGTVILQGMAAWCSSCTIQVHELKKATETTKDINVILIDIQPGNGNFQEFIKDLPRTWYFISDENMARYFTKKYNIRTLDTTIILQDGTVIFRDDYLTPRDKIRRVISDLKK